MIKIGIFLKCKRTVFLNFLTFANSLLTSSKDLPINGSKSNSDKSEDLSWAENGSSSSAKSLSELLNNDSIPLTGFSSYLLLKGKVKKALDILIKATCPDTHKTTNLVRNSPRSGWTQSRHIRQLPRHSYIRQFHFPGREDRVLLDKKIDILNH